MKKLNLLVLCTFLMFSFSNAQELINGGNMEDSTAWNFYFGTNGADSGGFYEFNYTDDTPAEGEGGCYRVSTFGQSATFLWQEVELSHGHKYYLTGAFKNASVDSITNTWIELILTRTKPSGGEVSKGNGDYMYTLNTWMDPDTLNLDGTFQEYFEFQGSEDLEFVLPDTVTTAKWYVVVKAGIWNTLADTNPTFDFLFDEISLTDLGLVEWTSLPVENIIDGEVDNADDYSGVVNLKWDADSLYIVCDIIDEYVSATTSPDIWNNDNVEIYIDATNGKIANWPRDNGWPPAYTNGSGGYYQLRVVPDSAWLKYNAGFVVNTNLKHDTIDGGYTFTANIPWSDIDTNFVPEAGKKIGFDVLASDNDGDGRNQITWNCPNTLAYVDPAAWGQLLLTPSGTFMVETDTEKPSAPAAVNATVTGSDITITWDACTDNRVVQNYIIFQGNTAVDTILAKQTGNSFEFKGLALGNYTLGVTAMDLYGNKSNKVTTSVTLSGVEDITAETVSIYPNPSSGKFNIVTESTAPVSFNVYNVAGGLVNSGIITGKYTLDLSSLSEGVYFMHLNNGNSTQIRKLVIQ